ncbi:ankyrin repeat domain-containing protein [Rubricoccus marinus]|uniref:Uncharacterized protein n=1 Tax=Rubricoccus marinus TaxID=716817 RepID=A0A259U2X7_9BACT|nr:ankyrin repeat domain-containing protein [Rubricoccus marinus]OZC04403.1 hypothetical protein BSZ36_16300 [Rubricoccus marinus]
MRPFALAAFALAGCATAQPSPEAPPSADLASLVADAPHEFAAVRGVADTTQTYGYGDLLSRETLYRAPLAADSAREALVTVTTDPEGHVTSSYRARFGLSTSELTYDQREERQERISRNEATRDAIASEVTTALPGWELDSGLLSRLRVLECPGFYGRRVEISTGSDGVTVDVQSGERPCLPETSRALLAAAASGDVATIEAALDAGAPLDASGDETGLYSGSALLTAARAGHEDAVRLLLARGADPNATDAEGFAPLNVATAAISQLLIDAGAEVNVTQDFANRAPLPGAAIDDDLERMQLLLDAGADPDAQLPVLENQGALHFAVTNGSPEAVRILLDAGANPDLPDALGYTPLLNAVSGRSMDSGVAIEIAQLLLASGADVNRASNDFNSYAWTPLMEAARNGEAEIVRFLLAVDGVDLGARSTEDVTALGVARGEGHAEVIALLEAAGAPE